MIPKQEGYSSPEKKPARYAKQPIIEKIRGILLIPRGDYVQYCDTRGLCGLEAQDLCIPGGIECLREILEPLFMNESLTQELLQKIKEEIILYYRAYDHPVVSVYVPEQEIQNGVIQMVVLESCVGQVCASGNCWFSSWIYESFIRLGPGDAITADTLLTDVAWLNRNPFRDVDVVFTPGCDPGTTNIELVVCDRCPFQVYTGMDNAGTSASGPNRYYVGGTWGNAFWLDHILTYQYTTSHDFKDFQSHTGHYTIPLYWRHLLIFYGGYFTVKPDQKDLDTKGKGYEISGRYTIPFGVNYDGRLQEWTFGFDFKNMNNNLLFIGDESREIVANDVNLSQFMTGYAFACESWCGRFAFNLDIYGSPGKLFPKESNKRYDMLSPNAKVKYIYGRTTIGYTLYLPWCWSIATLARGQYSSQNLLPSERFGIGGYDTVRGYRERELNVDNAFVGNIEIRTPCFSLLEFFNICSCKDEMLFLVFFDYGIGGLHHRDKSPIVPTVGPSFGKTEYAMGVGPGWRYTINRYFSARLDWGVKLHRNVFSGRARSRFHGGFVLSY